MSGNTGDPLISVVMANFDGAAHIAVAVRSVLRQTERALELIVSDDGSSDDSLARAAEAAGGDPRLVLLRSETQTGPGAARNRALRAARGTWIAIVDNDDFIHPERLERLVRAAEMDKADIVADDLLTFYDDGARAPHGHLRGVLAERPHWISAAAYEFSNRLLSDTPGLGYLKPVFRRVGPNGEAPVYDESLRIGEDADLILRLLIGGARMRLYPALGYFYRKHAGSVSHRLKVENIDAITAAYERITPLADASLARELLYERVALADARAFAEIVAALKARDLGAAARASVKRPGALVLFKDAVAARLSPRRPAARAIPRRPRVTLLSRQRIVGATNGSSAYVLALADALKSAGYAVDYLGASPKIFGRWAMMRLRPETGVFDRYVVHGGMRAGAFVFARDPGVWAASGLAVLERGLARLGMKPGWSRPATYAQGAVATRADELFVARNAARGAEAVFCDYAFLTALAPHALAPGARSFTIMHDLMSARVGDKAEQNTVDLDAASEFRMLGLGDVVVAIQQNEAAKVRHALPQVPVVLAPHAAAIAPAAQPGRDDTLLFVGSNTAPNVVGLEWFFREIWPAIRAARPNARLQVAGSVSRALGAAPEGVTMLGVVRNLGPLYREAGVVISPLYTGSGLKIKLIEALAAGKAVVGASVTAQGVEGIVADAMVIADEPAAFAQAAIALLGDGERRGALAAAALACAMAHFSADACFRDLIAAVRARHTLRAEAPPSQ